MPAASIPHQPPMRFLVGEVTLAGDQATVAALVPRGSLAAVGDLVRPAYLIEIAAQAAAAAAAASAADGAGRAVSGMLVGVRTWRWLRPVPVDTALEVRVREVGALGELRQIEAAIAVAGDPAARGTLQVART